MTGSDYHAAGCALLFHGERNRRCGRDITGQLDRNAACGNYFGCQTRCTLRGKPRVVADDDPSPAIFILQNVGSNGPGHATYIVEGEIVGDNAAPTVGSEFDFSHKSW